MIPPQGFLNYCYFSFTATDNSKHELRVWVTGTLCLEWKLYVDNEMVAVHLDKMVNPLVQDSLIVSLSYVNVLAMYERLLLQKKAE